MDYITSLIYLGDIILSFRTTYLDNFGDEITDVKRIASNYLTSSTFWIDTLSLLSNPFTSMLDQERYGIIKTVCSFLGMFKIVRFTRFRAFIRSATFDKNLKAMLNFFYFIFLLVIYVHFVACLWYLVVHWTYCKMNPQVPVDECKGHLKAGEYTCPPEGCRMTKWIPPYDFYDYTQSNFFEPKEVSSKMRRYWVCMYYMVLVIGGNELGP